MSETIYPRFGSKKQKGFIGTGATGQVASVFALSEYRTDFERRIRAFFQRETELTIYSEFFTVLLDSKSALIRPMEGGNGGEFMMATGESHSGYGYHLSTRSFLMIMKNAGLIENISSDEVTQIEQILTDAQIKIGKQTVDEDSLLEDIELSEMVDFFPEKIPSLTREGKIDRNVYDLAIMTENLGDNPTSSSYKFLDPASIPLLYLMVDLVYTAMQDENLGGDAYIEIEQDRIGKTRTIHTTLDELREFVYSSILRKWPIYANHSDKEKLLELVFDKYIVPNLKVEEDEDDIIS